MLELDPRIAKTLSSTPPQPLRAETLSTFRTASKKPAPPPSAGVERRDYIIDPEHAVAIRVHRPAGAEGGFRASTRCMAADTCLAASPTTTPALMGGAGVTAASACRWSTA